MNVFVVYLLFVGTRYVGKYIVLLYNFYFLGLLNDFIMIRRIVGRKRTDTILRVRYFSLIPDISIFNS